MDRIKVAREQLFTYFEKYIQEHPDMSLEDMTDCASMFTFFYSAEQADLVMQERLSQMQRDYTIYGEE